MPKKRSLSINPEEKDILSQALFTLQRALAGEIVKAQKHNDTEAESKIHAWRKKTMALKVKVDMVSFTDLFNPRQ